MIRLATTCTGLLLCAAGLIVAALLVGGWMYAPPPLLTRIDGCDLACWDDVMFNLGDQPAANRWLDANGLSGVGQNYTEAIAYRDGGERCQVAVTYLAHDLTNIRFAGCGDITLGDLILALGPPESVIATGGSHDWLRWHGGLIDATTSGWDSPFIQIDAIGLKAPANATSVGTSWHGFISITHYCQLESAPYPCRNPSAAGAS